MKMRTRTAGAQGLLSTGLKCNPIAGQKDKDDNFPQQARRRFGQARLVKYLSGCSGEVGCTTGRLS
jgi:hypothetical protein